MRTMHSNPVMVWAESLIVAGSLLAAASPAAGSTVKTDFLASDYRVIIEQDRNIFDRNRAKPVTPDPSGDTTKETVNPESLFVLRGIANENGMALVFLEDAKQGVVLVKRIGDDVAIGRITGVTDLDEIQYQAGEATRTVRMGCTLEGVKVAVPNLRQPGAATRGSEMRRTFMQGRRSRQSN
jgi:hypothetical protein